jgi:hypothetical protein
VVLGKWDCSDTFMWFLDASLSLPFFTVNEKKVFLQVMFDKSLDTDNFAFLDSVNHMTKVN